MFDMRWPCEAYLLRRGLPRQRWEIEARLLAGQSDDEIAGRLGVEAEVVLAYEKIYFDVRDKLESTDWIRFNAIGPGLYQGFDPGDLELVWKVYAFHLGPLVLDDLIAATGGGTPGTWAGLVDPRVADLLRLSVAIDSIPATPDHALDLLRLFRLNVELTRKEADSDAGAVNWPIVVGTFEVPVPADSGYQGAPGQDATEPREHEEGRADRQLRTAG
jgi:hypothetical protein